MYLAEKVGFEPTVMLPLRLISSEASKPCTLSEPAWILGLQRCIGSTCDPVFTRLVRFFPTD